MNGNLSIKVCGVWSFWQSGLLDWVKEITTLIIRKKNTKHKTKQTKKKKKKKKTKQKKKKLKLKQKTKNKTRQKYFWIFKTFII